MELFSEGSRPGESSTTSAPTKFFLWSILMSLTKEEKSSPPGSGVPVPGTKEGSK